MSGPSDDPRKDDGFDLLESPQASYEISRTRKILVWLFIFAFWVFFYWYRSDSPKPPPQSGPEKTETAPTKESILGGEPRK